MIHLVVCVGHMAGENGHAFGVDVRDGVPTPKANQRYGLKRQQRTQGFLREDQAHQCWDSNQKRYGQIVGKSVCKTVWIEVGHPIPHQDTKIRTHEANGN